MPDPPGGWLLWGPTAAPVAQIPTRRKDLVVGRVVDAG